MPASIPAVAVYSGDTLTLEYRFRDAADAAVDVSAFTFTASWRTAPSAATDIDFTVNQTNAATGIVILTLTAVQTASMGQSGVFDLRGTNGPVVRTFVTGATVHTPSVTRG